MSVNQLHDFTLNTGLKATKIHVNGLQKRNPSSTLTWRGRRRECSTECLFSYAIDNPLINRAAVEEVSGRLDADLVLEEFETYGLSIRGHTRPERTVPPRAGIRWGGTSSGISLW